MSDTIFGAANLAEFYEVEAGVVGALLYSLDQIASSSVARNGDLTWTIGFTQDEDSGALQEFIEAKVNADDAGGGSTDPGKYQDGTDRPSAASSGGSSSVKLCFALVYGGVNNTGERKLWAGYVKMLASSGGYEQADATANEPNVDFQSVAAPEEVTLVTAGDVVPNATYVDTATVNETVAAGSKGRPYHVPNAV